MEPIAKAHRAQADALEIEAAAKRRLADEYDAAIESGEIGKKPGPKIVSGMETISATEVMPPKLVHEARQIRDAEKVNPGIVRRTLNDRLDKGQEPTKAALREAVVETAKQGPSRSL